MLSYLKGAVERQKVQREACSDLRQEHVYSHGGNVLSPTCVDGQTPTEKDGMLLLIGVKMTSVAWKGSCEV